VGRARVDELASVKVLPLPVIAEENLRRILRARSRAQLLEARGWSPMGRGRLEAAPRRHGVIVYAMLDWMSGYYAILDLPAAPRADGRAIGAGPADDVESTPRSELRPDAARAPMLPALRAKSGRRRRARRCADVRRR